MRQVGDIGLIGTTAKDKTGKPSEAVDIYLGGGIGQTAGMCVDFCHARRREGWGGEERCRVQSSW